MPGPNTLTEDIYWASLPPVFQPIRSMPQDSGPNGPRWNAASALAGEGYTVIGAIVGWGWSALFYMQDCQINNLSAARAIGGQMVKVSTDAADYPPFIPPPPPPPPVADHVGSLNYIDPIGASYLTPPRIPNTAIYNVLAGDTTPNDAYVTDSRGTFLKRVIPTPFGINQWYELPL